MKVTRARYTLGACLLLLVVTAALYSPVRYYPFLNYDDQQYVTRNSHVQAGLTWNTFAWAWTATEASNWHPLSWLSHALDWQLYGPNAGGHHLTSLLLHNLNVVLLFVSLWWATRLPGRSLLVAALFALHPLNVESVVWIAERKNVLSTAFFLLAICAYGWYTTKPSLKRYLILTVLFALGLAAKPMVITLPFVLLLLDFWPLARIQGWGPWPSSLPKAPKNRKGQSQGLTGSRLPELQAPLVALVLEKLPLLALCTVSAALTVIAQRTGGAVRSLAKITLWARIENAVYSYAMYIWKAFWPARLALYYPPNRPAFWKLGFAFLFLLAVSGIAWKQRFTRRYMMFGWLWYLGTLVPVIGVVQVGDQAMADRYAYVPLIGIFIMVVWSLADWADNKQVSVSLRTAAAVIALAILSFLTWRQVGYWQSNSDVWAHTLAATGPNPIAEKNLGDALHALGHPEDALAHFQNAVAMQSTDPARRIDLAEDLAECGRLPEAIVEYEEAIRLTAEPASQARSYGSLAILYGEVGEYFKARESYRKVLRIDPQLGDEMIRNLSRAFAANPSGGGYLSLGMLLEAAGRIPEARIAYQQALKLDPALAEARQSLDALEPGNR
jgi:tetratricopeptide (TPR) repeat protein